VIELGKLEDEESAAWERWRAAASGLKVPLHGKLLIGEHGGHLEILVPPIGGLSAALEGVAVEAERRAAEGNVFARDVLALVGAIQKAREVGETDYAGCLLMKLGAVLEAEIVNQRYLEEKRRAARSAVEKRERKRKGWRDKLRRLDSTSDELGRKERAYVFAQRLGLSERTVYDALPRRSVKKTSRSR